MARLVNLEIKEISAVDRPANKRRILIIKAATDPIQVQKKVVPEGDKFCLYDTDGTKLGTYSTRAEAEAAWRRMKKAEVVSAFVKVQELAKQYGEPMLFDEAYLLERLDEIQDAMFEACYALRGSIMSILTGGGDPEMIDTSVQQFAQQMSSTIKSWLAGEVGKQEENETMLTKEQIAKIADPVIRKAAEELLAEYTAQLEAAKVNEAALKSAKEELEKVQKSADEKDPEAIWKDANPAIRKKFEDMEKDLKLEKTARRRSSYLAKAAQLNQVPQSGTPDQFADLLAEIDDKLSPESAEALNKIFAGAHALMKRGVVLTEVGKIGNNLNGGNVKAVVVKIEEKAHEIAKRQGLTNYKVADLYGDVFKAEPELYAEYERAQRIEARQRRNALEDEDAA